MPTAERLDVFTPFLKKERDGDGVLWVEGKFTGPDLDGDGQRMDPTWLREACPAYARIGNVREGHDPHRAIGKAMEVWETDDHSWHMRAKIVDEAAARKIEHSVLTGFSVGIANPVIVKAADAPHGKITSGSLIEVSAVDRPCLPSAMLRIAGVVDKAAGSMELVDDQHLDEDPDVEKAADGDVIARPQMLLKTATGEMVPMTAELVDSLSEPAVVANPDDPDAADPEALEKAKKAGKKTPPVAADDKPKADGDDTDESDDDEDDAGKKPATKAADVDIEALVKSLVAAELAKRDAPAVVEPEPESAQKAAEPDVIKSADDEMADIARAKRVLADLACLVQSEAAGFLSGGGFGEVADMDMLVSVMATLTCFVERETYELEAAAMAETTAASGDITPVPTVMQLAATPDVEKAAEPAVPVAPATPSLSDELNRRIGKALKKARKTAAAKAAATETPAPVAVSTTDTETLTKAVADKVTADLTAQLGDVFTKAMGPVIDRVAEVETLLKSTPRPGGPVVTRVQPQVSPAESAERVEKAAQARVVKAMLAANPAPEYRASLMAQLAELEPPAAA